MRLLLGVALLALTASLRPTHVSRQPRVMVFDDFASDAECALLRESLSRRTPQSESEAAVVEAVALAEHGIVSGLRPGAIYIDHTTTR